MRLKIAIPVLAAAIAAGASVVGVLVNQRSVLNLEREKWRQSVQDRTSEAQRQAIVTFAAEFSSAFNLMRTLLWRVEMQASSLTARDFALYEQASLALQPKLASAEILLATTSRQQYLLVAPLIAEYRRIDEQLVVAGPNLVKHRDETFRLLNTEVDKVNEFYQRMTKSLSQAHSVSQRSPTPNP